MSTEEYKSGGINNENNDDHHLDFFLEGLTSLFLEKRAS